MIWQNKQIHERPLFFIIVFFYHYNVEKKHFPCLLISGDRLDDITFGDRGGGLHW